MHKCTRQTRRLRKRDRDKLKRKVNKAIQVQKREMMGERGDLAK